MAFGDLLFIGFELLLFFLAQPFAFEANLIEYLGSFISLSMNGYRHPTHGNLFGNKTADDGIKAR